MFILYLHAHWLQTSMSVVADQTDVTNAQIFLDRTAVNVKMDTITLQQQILALVSEQFKVIDAHLTELPQPLRII